MNPFDLESIIRTLEEPTYETVGIDVSDLFGHPEGSAVWQFREPSLPEIFSVNKVAQQVQKQHPDWPIELTSLVALISLSYVKPEGSKQHPYILVGHLAKRMGTDFVKFSARWKSMFPHLDDLKPLAEQEKNDDGTDVPDSASVPDPSAPPAK